MFDPSCLSLKRVLWNFHGRHSGTTVWHDTLWLFFKLSYTWHLKWDIIFFRQESFNAQPYESVSIWRQAAVSSFERSKSHYFGSESRSNSDEWAQVYTQLWIWAPSLAWARGVGQRWDGDKKRETRKEERAKAGRTTAQNGRIGMKQSPVPQTTTGLVSPLALRWGEYLLF